MLETVRKIFLALLFFLALLVFIHPSGALAASKKCCAVYNQLLPLEPYYYDPSSQKCITALTPTSLNNLIGVPCAVAPVLGPICGLLNGWNPSIPVPDFPPRCDTGLVCNPSSQTCEDPKSAAVTKPSCPPSQQWEVLGYCCASNINPVNFNSLTAFLQVVQNGNLCSPPSAKKYCGEVNWVYQDGKCVKRFDFPWKANLVCAGSEAEGVDTAIGCVPTDDLTEFLKFVLKYAFFASGGIILLMIIATGYMLMTSAGNPEKLQAAKENIVALFSGLILIAFSLVLLQVVGADVLKLPTFIP